MGYPFHERWRHRGYLVRFQPRMLIFWPYAVRRFRRRVTRAATRAETGTEIEDSRRYVEEQLKFALNIATLCLRRRDYPLRVSE